jgi:hypothetical protein
MLNTRFAIFCLLLSVSCSTGSTEVNEDTSYTLRFSPQQGEKKEILFDLSCRTAEPETNITFSFLINAEVKKVTDGKTDLQLTYSKICATGTSDNNDIHHCAGDSIPEAITRFLIPTFSYKNSAYLMEFDNRMHKLRETALAANSDSTVATWSKLQFFITFPDSAIKPGAKWEDQLNWSADNKKKAFITYTLDQVKNGIAGISFEGNMEARGEGFGQEYSLKAILKGMLQVDVKTGWTIDATMQQDVTIVVNGEENKVLYSFRIKIK